MLDVIACLAAGSDDGTAGIAGQGVSHEVQEIRLSLQTVVDEVVEC